VFLKIVKMGFLTCYSTGKSQGCTAQGLFDDYFILFMATSKKPTVSHKVEPMHCAAFRNHSTTISRPDDYQQTTG